jgi:hypothetical protein
MSVNVNSGVFNLSEHICQTEHNSFENKNNLDYLAYRLNELKVFFFKLILKLVVIKFNLIKARTNSKTCKIKK